MAKSFKDINTESDRLEWLYLQPNLAALKIKELVPKVKVLNNIFDKFLKGEQNPTFTSNPDFQSINTTWRSSFNHNKERLLNTNWDELIEKGDFTRARNLIEETLNSMSSQIVDFSKHVAASAMLAILMSQPEFGDPVSLTEEIRLLNKQARKGAEEIEETKNKLSTQFIDNLQERAIENYDSQFIELSSEFNKTAANFFKATLLSLLFLSISYLTTVLLRVKVDIFSQQSDASFVFSQIAIISVPAWLTFFFSRNYSVNKNLAYLYKQKETMIKTYIPFVESIGLSAGDENRSKVSAELAKILFEIPQTGFVKNSGETNDSSPSVLIQQIDRLTKA